MKIALISPSTSHLQDMTLLLEARSHAVIALSGGKHRMRAVADEHTPDLLLVDGMCHDAGDLVQIEHLTAIHPKMAVILLCASHTPDFLISAMRAGVREVLPSPPPAEALAAAVDRVAARLDGARLAAQGKIVALLPCKGGSGATFLATNLGYQLAQRKSVLLIDLNTQFGDALSFVHDAKPPLTLADVASDIQRMDASFLAASAVRVTPNYSVLAAPEDPSQAMEVKPEHVDAILAQAVTQYDFVLLDLGRHLDTLSVKALDRASRIFPVLQATLPHVRNASKFIDVCKSLNYPMEKVCMIVNRFERTNEIGLDDIRRALGDSGVHTVANSFKEVNTSVNQGIPLIERARSNPVVRDLGILADQLAPREEESRGLLGRLFKRA